MSLIYKILPYAILSIVAGFMIAMAGGETVWGYIGIGLMFASVFIVLGVMLIITLKHWRRNKASADKRYSEVSMILIFNAVGALLLFAYITWKDIVILHDENMFLIIWMGINLGALRTMWVPKDEEAGPNEDSNGATDNKKEVA